MTKVGIGRCCESDQDVLGNVETESSIWTYSPNAGLFACHLLLSMADQDL